MKQTIRFNTFETNSSSTHNLVIIEDKDYEAWENNELYFIKYHEAELKDFKGNVATKEQLIECGYFKDMPTPSQYDQDDYDKYEEDLRDYIEDHYLVTDVDHFDDDYLEQDEHVYKTENGDVIHIICKYGYDG